MQGMAAGGTWQHPTIATSCKEVALVQWWLWGM
jgi:hypothetical protein